MDDKRTMLRPLEVPANCLNGGCDYWPRCEHCGFDRIEDGRRKCLLHFQGLSKGKKGLWTLKVGRDKR